MVRGFADAGDAWLDGFSRHDRDASTLDEVELASVGHNRGKLPFSSTGPHGHRRRMRERLLGAGPAGLADYEVLEMLLFLAIPRRDTKPLAKSLINCFGSLAGVLSASPEALAREGGLDADGIVVIGLPELAARRLSGAEIRDRPVLSNWERLLAYLEIALTGAIAGQLRILFLDNRNRLLADEVIEDASAAIAGLEAAQPDPSREAMRRALDLHATALILIRIVPPGALGRPILSREAGMAARLSRAAAPLAIVLHDHMLVGGENWISLRQTGLL